MLKLISVVNTATATRTPATPWWWRLVNQVKLPIPGRPIRCGKFCSGVAWSAVAGLTIARESDGVMPLMAGPELALPSTDLPLRLPCMYSRSGRSRQK